MSQFDDTQYQFETLALRSGHTRSFEGEHAEPIFLTSSFVYANAAEAAAKFSGQEAGNIYSRFTNPTVATFEKRIAALEGAERAVATGSGMAAIMSVVMTFLKAGDHVLCSRSVFGSTVALFEKYVADGIISGGMIPKLENSFEAINAGVKQVVITRADLIHTSGGTKIVK